MERYIETYEIPNFGIGYLTIKEAAELVATDMFASGEFSDIEEQKDWNGNMGDPNILMVLKSKIKLFEQRLITAIDKNQLKAVTCKRDFDEKIILESVYIDSDELQSWLIKHDYYPADVFSDWMEHQADIYETIKDDAKFLLNASAQEYRKVWHIYRLCQLRYREPESLLESNLEANGIHTEDLLAAYKGVGV